MPARRGGENPAPHGGENPAPQGGDKAPPGRGGDPARPAPRRLRRALRWLLPPLAAAGALALGFVLFLQAATQPAAPPPPAGLIVVLTGGAGRIEAGLRLLEAGAAPRLLVSGAAPGLTAEALARGAGRDPAALAGRLRIGGAAATTVGNAAETAAHAAALGVDQVIVVTAGFHMPRALLELGRALPPAVALHPHPLGPASAWGARLLAVEYAKYLAALAGITRLVPARESARP